MKKEIKPSDITAAILYTMVGISIVVLIGGLFVSKEPLKFAIGLVFGTVISLIRVKMLARAANIAVQMEPAEAKAYMTGQYNVRMMLAVAAAVFGGIMKAHLSVIALILGLLVMPPSVYIANFIYEKTGGEKSESVSFKKADRDS